MKQTPIIVIGMHRSGTSVLTRLLEQAGVFFGTQKDENDEALFFQRINIWILSQLKASWDSPYNARFLEGQCKQSMLRVAEAHLRGLSRIQFLGTRRFLTYRDVRDLNIPWGWKDPRNTFTLPVWLDVFPLAKIVHIYRNPIDVAQSLRQRELSLANAPRSKGDAIKEFILKGNVGYISSPRLLHLQEGIKLWMEYTQAALMIEQAHHDSCLSVKYESLLAEPAEQLKIVCNFLNMPQFNSSILKQIDPQRKYAFVGDEELVDQYRKVKDQPLMLKLGYDRIL